MQLRAMVETEGWAAFCHIDEATASKLFSYLDSQGYKSVGLAVARGVSKLLEWSDDEDPLHLGTIQRPDASRLVYVEPLATDMFLPDARCVLHVAISKIVGMLATTTDERRHVEVTAGFDSRDRPQEIDQFVQVVQQQLRELGALPSDASLERQGVDVDTCKKNLDKLPNLTHPPELLKRDLAAALKLKDKSNRDLVLDIRGKSPAILEDYTGRKGGPATPKTTKAKIEELVQAGLLELAVAAICKKNF